MASPISQDNTTKKSLSTSNVEIDKKLGGGIPCGSLTLIEGESDAGKSVLAQQLMWGALESQLRVLLYTSENTSRSLLRQMASLSLDIMDYFLLGRIRVYAIPNTSGAAGQQSHLTTLLEHIPRQRDRDVIVIDALTGLIADPSEQEVFAFFKRCKEFCDAGLTIVCIVHSHAFSESLLSRIRAICDAHVKLRVAEVGDQLVKQLEVAKVRGADKATGSIMSFNVEPGMGMRIIPISRARA